MRFQSPIGAVQCTEHRAGSAISVAGYRARQPLYGQDCMTVQANASTCATIEGCLIGGEAVEACRSPAGKRSIRKQVLTLCSSSANTRAAWMHILSKSHSIVNVPTATA